MQQPERYENNTDQVWNIKRSLYGLKQGPRCWRKRFGTYLSSVKFRSSQADPCLYIRVKKGEKVIVVLFVDDRMVMTADKEEANILIQKLKREFKITAKPASYFLGMKFERFDDGPFKIC
ncbi:hypothetical protein ILUMI_07451 [Ignelater luminosus]|uniref:Reverse transcriptase Ty1/copia-type domain-containing protein n=1 Tax=Ignelater luminosus TaxID=2038154 RepID=A0A8K0GGB9_IGNLU|nr:hypothetical protein ILUMI_07451 [Ignelater luminosus]